MNTSTAVLAKRRAVIPARASHLPPEATILILDVPIPPRSPLHVGLRVHVEELLPCSYLSQEEGDLNCPHYCAEDLEFEGTIVAIRAVEASITEFVVRNENDKSSFVAAYMAVKHVQGITVDLRGWQRIARWLALPFLQNTREIPIEADAIILRNEWVTVGGRRIKRAVESYGRIREGRERARAVM
ncbi:hypothetical protein FKP32DRAFT_1602112 [Trametes sanguinea]|nr:hypothetical protein FKP32DRAFT_1602112 [Trametes sanguinea]